MGALWFVATAAVFAGIGAVAAVAVNKEAGLASGHQPDARMSCPASRPLPAEYLSAATALATLLANSTVAQELDPSDPDSYSEMYDKARLDPASRAELLERYRDAPPGEAKRMLRGILLSMRAPDVFDFFMELAADSDPDHRRDAFEVLRITGRKVPEMRNLVLQALTTEQDPTILSNAIGALQPGLASESEAAAVLQQLRGFAQHSDPQVRAQSIRGLAGWDKTGESIPFLRRALADAAPEVRSAAVVSIIENRVRTDELKQMLMRIAHAAEESPGLRTNAVIALERFALSSEEYAHIMQSAMEADALLDSQLDSAQ
jgi:hypothetical protein